MMIEKEKILPKEKIELNPSLFFLYSQLSQLYSLLISPKNFLDEEDYAIGFSLFGQFQKFNSFCFEISLQIEDFKKASSFLFEEISLLCKIGELRSTVSEKERDDQAWAMKAILKLEKGFFLIFFF